MKRGPILMVIGTFCFACMIAAVRVARTELSAFEVIAWRAIIAMPLAFLLALRTGFHLDGKRLFAARSAFGFSAMVCFYGAAKGLSVADISLLGKLQPVLIGILAPMIWGQREKVGWLVWVALIGGLLGSFVLLGPSLAVGSMYGVYAVIGAVLSAGAHLAIRGLGKTDAPEAIVFWFQLSLVVLGSMTALIVDGHLPSLPSEGLWAPVAITGVSATLGQYFMTKAYTLDRAAIIAGASYAGPIWAVLIDLAVFDQAPSVAAAAGGSLIVLSGLVFVRENREDRHD
jgi:drug/metabolite transporter (DMT)-like permease